MLQNLYFCHANFSLLGCIILHFVFGYVAGTFVKSVLPNHLLILTANTLTFLNPFKSTSAFYLVSIQHIKMMNISSFRNAK